MKATIKTTVARKPAHYLTFEEFMQLPEALRNKPDALSKSEPDAVRQKHGLSPRKPLPCPFCGQKPRFSYIPAPLCTPELDRPFYSLTCHRPSNRCPAQPVAFGDTKAEAIENWNTRAPLPLTSGAAVERGAPFDDPRGFNPEKGGAS